jgi:hypothetical protein
MPKTDQVLLGKGRIADVALINAWFGYSGSWGARTVMLINSVYSIQYESVRFLFLVGYKPKARKICLANTALATPTTFNNGIVV